MAQALGVTFRQPEVLWLLVAVPFALALLVASERRRRRLSRRFVSERMRWVDNGLRVARPAIVAAGLTALLVALAGPQLGFRVVPIEEREANRVFVIDVSESMDAQDVGTSRLEAAKSMAQTLMKSQNGRVALVVFEGEPQVVSPLTTDTEAVSALLESIDTGEIPASGTDLGAALQAAEKITEADAAQRSDIVVISDGEDQGKRLDAALEHARDRGVAISTILVGSLQGAPIPVEGRELLRDNDGAVVTTRAHAEILERVARTTGGHFLDNPRGAADLAALSGGLSHATGRQKLVRIPLDRFQWPLALGFALVLFGSIANRGAE